MLNQKKKKKEKELKKKKMKGKQEIKDCSVPKGAINMNEI